ncbi:MAG TPA: hypothetical protein VK662_06120 [Acidothermaceae bacterium]|jgi:hypothetical protein|nr:hypothetical protein [Acidothermaceae bacterium]
MHPDLLQSLVNERITELRGARNRRPVGRRSLPWASSGKARVGQLFVRLGTSLIGDGAGHASQLQVPQHQSQVSRSEPACGVR